MKLRPLLVSLIWPLFPALSPADEVTVDSAEAFRRLETHAGRLIDEARALGNLWSGTTEKFTRAQGMAETGRYSEAAGMLNAAADEARLAARQAHLERARYVFQRLSSSGAEPPAAEMDELWRMILAQDAERASHLADQLVKRHGP